MAKGLFFLAAVISCKNKRSDGTLQTRLQITEEEVKIKIETNFRHFVEWMNRK